jgi:hypothetical protein
MRCHSGVFSRTVAGMGQNSQIALHTHVALPLSKFLSLSLHFLRDGPFFLISPSLHCISSPTMRQTLCQRQNTYGIAACILVLFIFFLTPHSSFRTSYAAVTPKTEKLYGADYRGQSSPAEINRVTNDSLGFSKVFVVGLKERSDKRDALSLTGSLTGFHVEFMDGVRGEDIPDKAVPWPVDRKLLWETNLGSWRGHMNAIRR